MFYMLYTITWISWILSETGTTGYYTHIHTLYSWVPFRCDAQCMGVSTIFIVTIPCRCDIQCLCPHFYGSGLTLHPETMGSWCVRPVWCMPITQRAISTHHVLHILILRHICKYRQKEAEALISMLANFHAHTPSTMHYASPLKGILA